MKNVAPNLYFFSSGRATVKCDLLESSNVSTTSLSGIGSRALATDEASSRHATKNRQLIVLPRTVLSDEKRWRWGHGFDLAPPQHGFQLRHGLKDLGLPGVGIGPPNHLERNHPLRFVAPLGHDFVL